MNRLPDRQIDIDDPPRLGRIRRSGDGHVETLAARVGCDKAKLPQEFLQVAHKAWFIDDDVQAAEALRSCRNEVAFSHCRDEAAQVKGQRKAAVQPGAPLDPRKFSYPTLISIDTEQLPSVESARQQGYDRRTGKNWGSCSLERTRTKTISSTISKIRTRNELSSQGASAARLVGAS